MATHKNPLMLKALEILLRCGDENYKRMAKDVELNQLVNLAKAGEYQDVQRLQSIIIKYRPSYSSSRDVCYLQLNESLRFCHNQYFVALKALQYIAQQTDHPNRYEVAKALYNNGEKDGEKALREISQQLNHPNQKEASEILSWMNWICSVS